METNKSINPFTLEVLETHQRINSVNSLEKVNNAYHFSEIWSNTSLNERAHLFLKLAKELEDNKERFAKIASLEMGKVIKQAIAEIEKCAWVCRFYAENASQFLVDEIIQTEAHKSYVTYQPLGTILAIMPWNFPFYQVIRFLVPTLMAGNTALLKHASNVQLCAQALEKAFIKVGFNKGCFQNLNIDSEQVEQLIENEKITGITLTGSENAGRAIGALAGKNIKPSVLELGGNDAYIILEDCDFDLTIEKCVTGRIQNNGQTCIAAKRFIVIEAIYDQFISAFSAKMKQIKMGNPLNLETELGPLARIDLRNDLHQQVQESIQQGAQLILGGEIPEKNGAFYPPTILIDVKPGILAFEEELFGPVASIIKAKNEKEAIDLANQSKFGLGSGVFTSDIARGERIALQLKAGNSFVNTLTASHPYLPFGGIKASGYGRELAGDGLRTFTNKKTIYIQ